jgi:hypothetical protein
VFSPTTGSGWICDCFFSLFLFLFLRKKIRLFWIKKVVLLKRPKPLSFLLLFVFFFSFLLQNQSFETEWKETVGFGIVWNGERKK